MLGYTIRHVLEDGELSFNQLHKNDLLILEDLENKQIKEKEIVLVSLRSFIIYFKL